MMRLYRTLAFITILTPAYSISGLADDAAKFPNPNAAWVAKGAPEVHVKVDKKKETISVTVNQDGNQAAPKSLGITFYDADGNATALELKAVEPPPGTSPAEAPTQGHFAGTLGPAAQSFVGFEIQIPFGSESPTIIHSEDLKNSD